MPHVEQKTLARVTNTPTHDLTHSAVFASSLARHAHQKRPVKPKVSGKLPHSELLQGGVAAQDAFVALFDAFDDFDSMAHDAVTAALPPENVRAASK